MNTPDRSPGTRDGSAFAQEFDDVREQLRWLAEADAGRTAPPRVEAALLVAFREHHAANAAAVPFWRGWRVWPALAAATACLAFVILRIAAPEPVSAPGPTASGQTSAVQPQGLPAQESALPAPPQSGPVRAATARPKVKEFVTAFYPLTPGFDVAGAAAAPRVRVRLPGTVLSSFGLPVSPERIDEPVQADLVIGEDGLAHAIRFVRTVKLEYSQY